MAQSKIAARMFQIVPRESGLSSKPYPGPILLNFSFKGNWCFQHGMAADHKHEGAKMVSNYFARKCLSELTKIIQERDFRK